MGSTLGSILECNQYGMEIMVKIAHIMMMLQLSGKYPSGVVHIVKENKRI
jgi:hypothetical protein